MKALVLDAKARTANIQDVARATPASTELLVRVKAVSLNPIDPLYVTHPLGSSGRIVGSDFAGTVVEIGSGVPSASTLRTGSRVAGFLQGACSVNKRLGAFAEYLVVPWDLVWTIPDSISAEQAAGVSLVALTAAQAIWYRLGMDAPFPYDRQQDPEPREGEPGVVNISIYGASNSVALYAAQMARLSAEFNWKKIRLFGAASKARWNLLRAELHEADVRYCIHYAYDCISEGDSVQRTSSTLASNGKIAIVRSRAGGAWKADNLAIEPIYGAVWEGLGEEVQYQGFTVRQSPASRGFAVAFYKWMNEALVVDIVPNPIRMMPGGLEKVVDDGFQLLGAGGMEERQVKRTEE